MVKAHLFVLVHGLWGGAGHLKAIEDTLKSTITNSEEELHILRPKSSSFFKTYDGIQIIGQRMLLEVLEEIKSLGEDCDLIVTKISFVGYSLGGLVSRYIIGELEELGIFDYIEPCYFATFATPHVGTWFFKKRFGIVNFLGSNILGLVGSELFVKDENRILVQLTEGVYINGLRKFKKRFLFANVRHDRTVNFYTAFITDKNPFDEYWENLELSFDFKEKIIPTYSIKGVNVKPKIVNVNGSTFLPEGHLRQKPTWAKKLRYLGIVVIVSIILPIWIPTIFTASTLGSIASYFIVKTFKRPKQINDLKEKIIHHGLDDKQDPNESDYADNDGVSLHERLDEFTGEALENVINLGQYDTNTESARDRPPDDPDPYPEEETDDLEEVFDNLYENADKLFKNPTLKNEIFNRTKKLPLNEDRLTIVKNLNELDWYKFPVYVNVLNAHDGIVARKGLKRSTTKGIATVTFFSYMINRELKGDSRYS